MASTNSTNSTDVSAPLEVINDTDQGGLVAILAAFSLSLVLVSLPIRTYVRSRMGTYKMDDWAFLGACVISIAQASVVFYMIHIGFGKTADLIDGTEIEPMQRAAYASDILYIVAIAFSKLSTAFLFLRLTPGRGHFLAIWSTICTSILWAFVSMLLVAIRCHPGHPWTDVNATCPNLFVRWQFIGALDVITEVMLFSISVYLVWAVQINFNSKSIVVAAFGCRLPVIAIAGLRLYYLNRGILSADPTLVGASAVCCTQIEIGYSIMASIIPCLKTFIAPYEKTAHKPSQYQQYGKGTNYMLSSMASKSDNENAVSHVSVERTSQVDPQYTVTTKRGPALVLAKELGKLRPEQTEYQARVTHEGNEEARRSLDSGNSQRMIIKKGVEWSVDYNVRNAIGKEDEAYALAEKRFVDR